VDAQNKPALGHDYQNGVCIRCQENAPEIESSFVEVSSSEEESSSEESSSVEESFSEEESSSVEEISSEESSLVDVGSSEEDSNSADSSSEDSSSSDGDSEEAVAYTLSFKLNFDQTYYICSGLDSNSQNKTPSHIVIPDTYNEKEVRAVGDNAFLGNCALNKVTIGKNVATLGVNAFAQCANLYEIYDLSPALTIVANDYKHGGISSQVTVHTDASAESVISYIGDYVVYEKKLIGYKGNEKHLNIPDGIEILNSKVLSGRTDIESVTLPDSVKTIESYAFRNCTNLTKVVLGSNMKTIEVGAFEGTNLTNLQFDNDCLSGWSSGFVSTGVYIETPLIEDDLEDSTKIADIIMGRLSEYGEAYQGTWSRS
jgi:hypothetical protein